MTPTILQPYPHTEIARYYDMQKVQSNIMNYFPARSFLSGKDTQRIVVLQRLPGWISLLP